MPFISLGSFATRLSGDSVAICAAVPHKQNSSTKTVDAFPITCVPAVHFPAAASANLAELVDVMHNGKQLKRTRLGQFVMSSREQLLCAHCC